MNSLNMVYSLPHVFPLTVHLDDLGDLSDTQGYSGPVSHSCTPTQTLRKLWGGVVVVANKILVTSLKSRALGFDYLGFRSGLGLD